MVKYHISSDGLVRECKAKFRCPLGGTHFSSREKAEAFFIESTDKKLSHPSSVWMKLNDEEAKLFLQRNTTRAEAEVIIGRQKLKYPQSVIFLLNRGELHSVGRVDSKLGTQLFHERFLPTQNFSFHTNVEGRYHYSQAKGSTSLAGLAPDAVQRSFEAHSDLERITLSEDDIVSLPAVVRKQLFTIFPRELIPSGFPIPQEFTLAMDVGPELRFIRVNPFGEKS